MTRADELAVLRAEIGAHPGLEAEGLLESLVRSTYVFEKNFRVLLEALDRFEEIAVSPSLWAEHDRSHLHNLMMEVMRHVHNFLSGAVMVVNHMRRLVRRAKLLGRIRADYEAETQARFAEHGLSQFVQGLRSYMVHRGIPPHAATHTISRDRAPESSLVLDKTGLLAWKKWNKAAGAFLSAQPDQISLRGVLLAYHEHVTSFHEWFGSRVDDEIRADLEGLRRLRERYGRLCKKPQ